MYGAIDRFITHIERGVMLTAYLVLIFVVGVEALRRMVFATQAPWGPEMALNAFVWLSWFAMSANVRSKTHLAFLSIREQMPPVVQRVLAVVDCILWLVVGGIVVYVSWGVVEMHQMLGQTIFGTDIPLWAASIAVPLGWGFSMLRILQELYETLFLGTRGAKFAAPEVGVPDEQPERLGRT